MGRSLKRRDFTVGDIQECDTFIATCRRCKHQAVVPRIEFLRWEQHLLVTFLEKKLKCDVCGNKGDNHLRIV